MGDPDDHPTPSIIYDDYYHSEYNDDDDDDEEEDTRRHRHRRSASTRTMPNNSSKKNKQKKTNKQLRRGLFQRGANTMGRGYNKGKKFSKRLVKRVKNWYDDVSEYSDNNDEYGGYGEDVDGRRRRRDHGKGGHNNDDGSASKRRYQEEKAIRHLHQTAAAPPPQQKQQQTQQPPFMTQYQFEGYDNANLKKSSNGVGGIMNILPPHQPQSGQQPQEQGEYNLVGNGMPSFKWWTWKQEKSEEENEEGIEVRQQEKDQVGEQQRKEDKGDETYLAFLFKFPSVV